MFHLPAVYPLTDTRLSGLSHVEQVERLIAGGASLIQLRDKHSSALAFFDEAKQVITMARKANVRIIINDRVDLALALKADGVHLGQDDLPPPAARRLLGDDAIIGFSTHSIEQVQQALHLPVNYLAIGPIFSTSTKKDASSVVGIDLLRTVKGVVGDLPLVAIGGILLEYLPRLQEAGADSCALISALLSEPDQITNRIQRALSNQVS